MKNVFFRREDPLNRYSFCRQKKRWVLIVFLLSAILFFFYQFLFMSQLSKSELKIEGTDKKIQSPSKSLELKNQEHHDHESADILIKDLVRGVYPKQMKFYVPNSKGMFTCLESKVEINFSLVNDDFCDCPEDGSDEPGTNACNNGRFYCKHQPLINIIKLNVIPSSRVNDGICDCCDGSDEWNNKTIKHPLALNMQRKLRRYQVPCPNVCAL